MKKLLLLLNALFFLLVTTGQSALSSLSEDKITTQLGDLQVIYEGKKRYVEWNGKIIYKMPPKYRSLSFVKHFTNVKPAEIILINEHEGGSGCAGRYRLIALKQDGSYEVTKALGN